MAMMITTMLKNGGGGPHTLRIEIISQFYPLHDSVFLLKKFFKLNPPAEELELLNVCVILRLMASRPLLSVLAVVLLLLDFLGSPDVIFTCPPLWYGWGGAHEELFNIMLASKLFMCCCQCCLNSLT